MIRGLGEKLIELRCSYNLSQKEVAGAIRVSTSIISNYERNERVPSLEKIMALANLFHCSTDYLLGLKPTSTDNTIDTSKLTSSQKIALQNFIDTLK